MCIGGWTLSARCLGLRSPRVGSAALAAVCGVALLAGGCAAPPDAIRIQSNRVVVNNTTDDDWEAVEIWVNDHYRVTLRALLAGQRFEVPLSTFVAGFGQRFDPVRQGVFGIEVTARSAGGDVTLVWGRGRRR